MAKVITIRNPTNTGSNKVELEAIPVHGAVVLKVKWPGAYNVKQREVQLLVNIYETSKPLKVLLLENGGYRELSAYCGFSNLAKKWYKKVIKKGYPASTKVNVINPKSAYERMIKNGNKG